MENSLDELYKQYGEIIIQLEYLQNKYIEIKRKILAELNKQNNKEVIIKND